MSDLISRRALLKSIGEVSTSPLNEWDTMGVLNIVNKQPTVEAKEVVHGCVKTVVGKMGVMHQECSACGNVLEWKAYPNYCDECGAKLDGADMRKKV